MFFAPEPAAGPVFSRAFRLRGLAVCAAVLLFTPGLRAQAPPAPPASGPAEAPVFKVYILERGVYRVTYEDLAQAGLEAGEVDSHGLALTQRGEDVPIWIADGGDGRFGPGDRIELVGERLAGHRSFYNEYASVNVYRLRLDRTGGARMTSPEAPPAAPSKPVPLASEVHMEDDRFLLRFSRRNGEHPEPWYWARLTHIDPKPFSQNFWLHRLRPDPRRPTSLKVHLQGWSTAGGTLPDHSAEVLLNGKVVGAGEWDGEEPWLIEVPEVPADAVQARSNVLEVRIPRRRPEPEADAVIDEVILNWIEARYPRQPWIDSEPAHFVLPETGSGAPGTGAPGTGAPGSGEPVRLATAPGEVIVAYAGGARFDRRNMTIEETGDATFHGFQPPPGAPELHAVPAGKLRPPLAVELDRAAGLKDPTRQADYVIITHPRLREAIEPLADFHRRRGLEVTVVEVGEIYDDFNHSILDPRAIRDFLSHAYHHWRPPAPRFVLLVGDASWAGRAGWSSYGVATQKGKPRRNLIPAGLHERGDGPVASDNFYVAVDGDDLLPDMAIGRFPVTEPEEVAAIVDKILAYAAAGVGPWRRSILWITGRNPKYQDLSDDVAGGLAQRGFAAVKVYPPADEADNADHQEVLRRAFDQGQLLVHFYGHGGRFIWRTARSAYTQAKHDLFTLNHLERLAPAANLPLVLSMTCYSAPFDHPTADSIGEKFLRLEGRGAVGVLAASWRTAPTLSFSRQLTAELTSPRATIGEAIMRAKHHKPMHPSLVALFNLLGDPALELQVPEHRLAIDARDEGAGGWGIIAAMPEAVADGRAVVDWLDEAGNVIRSQQLEVEGAAFETGFRPASVAAEAAAAVSVYVWDEDAGVDGVGFRELGSGVDSADGLQTPK